MFHQTLTLKLHTKPNRTIHHTPRPNIHALEKLYQGLDLVRREWCTLSKDTGKFVLDRILSGEAREAVVAGIHEHLETLATSMRAGEVDVQRYVITKGLNKAPHEYPDAKSQPHVQVSWRGGKGRGCCACFFCVVVVGMMLPNLKEDGRCCGCLSGWMWSGCLDYCRCF